MNSSTEERLPLELSSAALNASPSSQRHAILVLGMHRSGTSAVSGVVSGLGVAAPKTLAPANAWNPRGYFESARIFGAHNELFAAVGSRWDDWRQLDPQRLAAETERRRPNIRKLLIEEFGDEPFILLKDPRMCRFIPFTLSILAELEIGAIAILPVRNPLEVAASLKRRDGIALAKSILLWLRYVLDAEFYSRNLPRYFWQYEKFVVDWRYDMDRAAQITGITWPDQSQCVSAKIDQFL